MLALLAALLAGHLEGALTMCNAMGVVQDGNNQHYSNSEGQGHDKRCTTHGNQNKSMV